MQKMELARTEAVTNKRKIDEQLDISAIQKELIKKKFFFETHDKCVKYILKLIVITNCPLVANKDRDCKEKWVTIWQRIKFLVTKTSASVHAIRFVGHFFNVIMNSNLSVDVKTSAIDCF